MEWGIMMTAVMLLGMFGIAMHQATTESGTPPKPAAKRRVVTKKEEIKRAA